MPSQKRPHSKKNKEWRMQCVDAAEAACYYTDESLRKSRRNKLVNYNLYSDILDEQDMRRICDPLDLGTEYTSPGKVQNYPLINPLIDNLIGENERRGFDYVIRVINQDAISMKEADIREMVSKFIITEIKNFDGDQAALERRVTEFKKKTMYDFQDLREIRANHIVRHLIEKENLRYKFNKCFLDALIAAEEIIQWDIISGEPVMFRLNPVNVHTVQSGESPFIEDSDIIVIEGWYSPGRIIDEYHEYLKPDQIDWIESYFDENRPSANGSVRVSSDHAPQMILDLNSKIDITASINGLNNFADTQAFDRDGNIRVLKVYWKSRRKMKKVKYFDKDTGEQLEDLRDERYVINKDEGESEEIIWINEWWEGHKIGGRYKTGEEAAVYLKMQPRPVQFRQMSNPSKCHPGIVGTIYNTNSNQGVSLMDKGKAFQYLYNAISYNVELLMATNWGKILRLPMHEVPEGWDVEKWLYYARIMKVAPYDAFQEGKKGAATGKLAGNMNQNNLVIDAETGNLLNYYVALLQHIEQTAYKVLGFTPQRLGAVSNRETIGGIERSVTQSSLSTEYWFAEHDFFVQRALQVGLETAKAAWRGQKKKLQYITDDMSIALFDVDGDELAEIDYDLTISSSFNNKKTLEALRQAAPQALQAQILSWESYVDILTTDSIAVLKKKIQMSEKEKKDYEQMKMQQAQQLQNQQLEANAMEKEKERDFKREEWNFELNKEITIEELKAKRDLTLKYADRDRDGIPDELEMEKVSIQRDIKDAELRATASENQKDREHEAKENAKDREVEKKKIAAQKAKSNKKTP